MSYTSEQLPNYFLKIDTQPNLQLAFKKEDTYRIPTQNECISYILERINGIQQELKLEKDKNEIQQAVLNDLLVRMTTLERK
jgi:hypothetical protein